MGCCRDWPRAIGSRLNARSAMGGRCGRESLEALPCCSALFSSLRVMTPSYEQHQTTQ